MAKTQAPLLSLGARGQIAKTIVASTWKGIKTMRQYVVPANPRTTAQVAHRTLFGDVVALWKSFITAPTDISAWNRVALQSGKPQSGFNAFTADVLALNKKFASYKLCKGWTENTPGTVTMQQSDNQNGSGDESPNYKLYVGPTEAKLALRSMTGLPNSFTYTPVAGDRFAKIVLADDDENYVADSSGIYPVTTA